METIDLSEEFPTAITAIFLIGFTLAINFIDLKDVKVDKKAGIKYVRVRKKVGDTHRFIPSTRKTFIYGEIIKVDKKSFVVRRPATGKKNYGKVCPFLHP